MSRKSFNICVVFDILDVTCPGVCICPKGMVYLEICLFGYNSSTSFVEPKFPLVFNETFSFHENFAKAFDLRGVQKCLEDKYVQITLTQVYKNKQVTLAIYNSNVDEMLYPERNHSNKNGKTALFMKNEPLFPGTISPKITVITKTSVTEQIHTILQNNHCSSQSLETQCWPNRMKRVHHSKQMNSECFNKIDHRYRNSPNEDEITSTDTDVDSQLYCHKAINNVMNSENYFQKSCTFCEDMNELKITSHRKDSSNDKNMMSAFKLKRQSSDNNKYKSIEIPSNKFGKNIKATFNVVPHHHYKCCKSKINNSSSSNKSLKISDEDSTFEEKSIRKSEHEKCKDFGEEPRKINPKIKAKLQLDVYHCKCGMPSCFTSPSWKNICREVNRQDTVGDEIKYQESLRNYYRRLYDGVTYQLSRNLKLL